jgi:hypothetical protein
MMVEVRDRGGEEEEGEKEQSEQCSGRQYSCHLAILLTSQSFQQIHNLQKKMGIENKGWFLLKENTSEINS